MLYWSTLKRIRYDNHREGCTHTQNVASAKARTRQLGRHDDGVYVDNEGVEYGVDAGMLSVIPIALCKRKGGLELGRMIHFAGPFAAEEENGVFTFGHLTINTEYDAETMLMLQLID